MMNEFAKINETYLEIINESLAGKIGTTALIGSTLLGNLSAAPLNNNSSKLNASSTITKTAQKNRPHKEVQIL